MALGHLLKLDDYRRPIDLDRPFLPTATPAALELFDDLAREALDLLAADTATTR